MKDNILKNTLVVTCEEFLKDVFGKLSKPKQFALTSLFVEVFTRKSTLVTDLSTPLKKGESAAERKRVQERVSGWLENYDFVEETNGWLLKNIPASADMDRLTFAVDFSDISKLFGGAGMEGMAMGYDGSTGGTAMGHDFICVSLVGAGYPEALPVYVKLAKGRKSKDELLWEAITAVMTKTGCRGWIVEDRGMDGAEKLAMLKRKDIRAVVRVNKMDRDVFGNGKDIAESFKYLAFEKALLHVHSGDRRVMIRFKPGVIQVCNGNAKNADVENVNVLVVESRFDGRSVFLYVTCPDEVLNDRAKMLDCAVRAAQAYCDRWQIETSFYVMKQEFALEKARVRTFKRLNNIFSLCVLAYVFATRRLRNSKGFKKILKFLSDNLETVSTKTHALLAGIRALVNEAHVRFISGRPRKPPVANPFQPEFELG